MTNELNELLSRRAERGEHRGADTLMARARRESDPTRGTLTPDRPHRAAWIPALGAVVAVVVAIGGIALLASPDRPTATTAPPVVATTVTTVTPTTVMTTSATMAIPSMTWEQIAEPGFAEDALITAIVRVDSDLIAVGSIYHFDADASSFPRNDTAVWTSSDGRSWERVGSEGFDGETTDAGRIMAIVEVSDGLVGMSSANVIWRSDDGHSWERIDDPTLGGSGVAGMEFLVSGPNGLVAAGYGERAVVVAVSADGRSWTLVDDEALGVSPEWLNGMVAGDFGYVLIGQERVSDFTMKAAMWVSPNGTDWDRIPDGTFDNGDPIYVTTELTAVGVTLDDGIVVWDRWGNAWLSYDGYDWRLLDPDEIPPTDALVDGDRALAATTDGLIASPDRGVTWGHVLSEPIAGLTRYGDGFIGFTSESLTTGMEAAFSHTIWIGTWDDSSRP